MAALRNKAGNYIFALRRLRLGEENREERRRKSSSSFFSIFLA